MKVAIVMGSDSDFPVVEKTVTILKKFGIDLEVRVLSAHRTPHQALAFSENAEKNGFDVIIAAAGKAAHLPGVLAAVTILPVIGLPIKSSTLDGMDSLFSIVQMPTGIPVATVAINGAENAALLAIHIMALKYDVLKDKLREYRKQMAAEVEAKDKALKY
jgi:5-(carboxyamino)imidazole ribonucleotide mutase